MSKHGFDNVGLIFELSGEHESLPSAEIAGCLEAEEIEFTRKEEDQGILIVNVHEPKIKEIAKRLALTHNIDYHLLSCEADEILNLNKPLEIGKGSFAVRAKRIRRVHTELNLKEIEKKVADLVLRENEVDLIKPEIEIRVIISNRCHMGRTLARIDRSSFEKRKGQRRPYFSPISLHPRLARALVNLSRVRRGQNLLDPFCGTGGVLMEASLVGAKPIGSDIDFRMVEGAGENLASLGINDVRLHHSDVSEIEDIVGKVDAIATDPPYGRSATTNKEEISKLYERAFEAFSKILSPGAYAAVVVPEINFIEIGKKYLNLKEYHAQRVHRSLTRNFCVFQKK